MCGRRKWTIEGVDNPRGLWWRGLWELWLRGGDEGSGATMVLVVELRDFTPGPLFFITESNVCNPVTKFKIIFDKNSWSSFVTIIWSQIFYRKYFFLIFATTFVTKFAVSKFQNNDRLATTNTVTKVTKTLAIIVNNRH